MSREEIPFFRAFISGILIFFNLLLSLVFLAPPIVLGVNIFLCFKLYKLPLEACIQSQ